MDQINDNTEQEADLNADEAARTSKAEALGLISDAPEFLGMPGDEPAAEVPAEPATEIQIGDKIFTNEQDAFAYARQLQQDKIETDAYSQGIKDALRKEESNLPKTPSLSKEEIEAQFYEDPVAFVQNLTSKVREDVNKERDNNAAAKTQEQQLWSQFDSKYPELAGKKDLVKMVLQQNNATIGQMTDHNAAMSMLAQKTKGLLSEWDLEAKPSTILANTTGGVTPGGQARVTSKIEQPKSVDFCSQIRQTQENKIK